jgi:hypothetical protein
VAYYVDHVTVVRYLDRSEPFVPIQSYVEPFCGQDYKCKALIVVFIPSLIALFYKLS